MLQLYNVVTDTDDGRGVTLVDTLGGDSDERHRARDNIMGDNYPALTLQTRKISVKH